MWGALGKELGMSQGKAPFSGTLVGLGGGGGGEALGKYFLSLLFAYTSQK